MEENSEEGDRMSVPSQMKLSIATSMEPPTPSDPPLKDVFKDTGQQLLKSGSDGSTVGCSDGDVSAGCSPLGFQRLLAELSTEYNRVVAQLRDLEEQYASQALNNPTTLDHGQASMSTTFFMRCDGDEGCASASLDRMMTLAGASASLDKQMRMPTTTFSRLEIDSENQNNHARISPFDIVGERAAGAEGGQELFTHLVAGHTSLVASCKKICASRSFDVLSSIAIISNAALYGWIANSTATCVFEGCDPNGNNDFDVVSICFTAWFCVEFFLRLWVNGISKFFCSKEEWSWNTFDMLMVFIDVSLTLGENINFSEDAQHLTIVRLFRVLRILRALRFVRLFRFFRELRMMVSSILRSGSSLSWSVVLLGLTIYTFAIYFIHVVSDHVNSSRSSAGISFGGPMQDEHLDLLSEMFGNLLRAEYTLYMAVSGGISWGEVNRLLIDIHAVHGAIFCFFTFFTTFALLNIITGIFVETSINSARSTREEVAQEHLNAESGFQEEMRLLFENADSDKKGAINFEEFESVVSRTEVKAYLDALGIEIDKAKSLFNLLDLDMSGEITVDEFTFGCARLKGGAKSIDLATLMTHTKRMSDQWLRFFNWTEDQFKQLHDFETRVEELLAVCATPINPRSASSRHTTVRMDEAGEEV